MYSCHIKKHILFWILVAFWLCGYVLWIDLTDQISTRFKETYDLWLSDEYLNVPYDPNYSKDPFGDAMKLYEWMSSQTKVAWVKYVEKALGLKGCWLSKKKQWAIEYYFLPEFRWEIARVMKMEMWDYGSKNYTFDEDIIMNYCREFYNCVTYQPGWDAFTEWQRITSGTPEDVKTNCKEFFQTNYREWQAEEKRVQSLQIAWLWNDKYINATIEESPYDLMTDLGVVWELSYLQAKRPITPVFFDLPVFSKSKDSLLNGQNWGGDCIEETYGGIVTLDGEASLWWEMDDVERNTQAVWERGSNTTAAIWLQAFNWSVKPLSRAKTLTIEWYDTLLEWLWAYRLNDDESAYYWSLCRDEEEAEPESIQEEERIITRNDFQWNILEDPTKVEYQELVDYMLEAVTSYASLSEEKAKEIEKKAWDVGKYNWAVTAEQTEAVAKKILGCYQSCVWLSVDWQFACMLKCSCWEIKSPIFDPDVNPGMWPIFMIRYCAVPAVNPKYFFEWSEETDSWSSTLLWWISWNGKKSSGRWTSSNWGWWSNWWWSNWWWTCSSDGWNPKSNEAILHSYNKWGTNMVSMEKWINEILWVVEKLAREWRLWMWTQQHNFLDSSTKLMDAPDTFSFTVAANKKKIGEKVWEPTDEYLKRTMNSADNNWLVATHVSNPLDNPATKNRYLLVSYEWEVVWDISASANADATRKSQWYLNVAPWFIVDQSENSNAARYAKISELFGDRLDEQWDFWAEKVDYLREMDSYAKSLYAKKW